MRGIKFEVDREHRKLFGVCAGISKLTGVDATFVRIAVVLLTVATWWTILFYGVAAWLGQSKRSVAYDIKADIEMLRGGARDTHQARMRDIDRRLAEVDDYVSSSESRRLSSEIDKLR